MKMNEKVFENKVLDKLEEGKAYRMLIMVKYIENGIMRGSTPMVSLHINKNINVFLLMERIKTDLRHFELEYSLNDYFVREASEVYIGWKEWLKDNEYNKSLSINKVNKILNDVLIEDNKSKIKKVTDQVIDGKVFEYINSKFPTMKTIEALPTIDQLGIGLQGGMASPHQRWGPA